VQQLACRRVEALVVCYSLGTSNNEHLLFLTIDLCALSNLVVYCSDKMKMTDEELATHESIKWSISSRKFAL
jgi:hypothetical protein